MTGPVLFSSPANQVVKKSKRAGRLRLMKVGLERRRLLLLPLRSLRHRRSNRRITHRSGQLKLRMFSELGDKLQDIFKDLRGHGTISETNINDALRQVRLALLEADVDFQVAKNFIGRIKDCLLYTSDAAD